MKKNEIPIVYDSDGEPWNNPAPAGYGLVGFVIVIVVIVAAVIVRLP